MDITVTIDDERIKTMVRERIAELTGDDSRYRDTPLRQGLRRLTDEALQERMASAALTDAIKRIVGEQMDAALDKAMRAAVDTRTARMVRLGFTPDRMSDEEKVWLAGQIEAQMKRQAERAKAKEVDNG